MFFPKLITIARNANKFISLFIHAFIQQILTEIAVCRHCSPDGKVVNKTTSLPPWCLCSGEGACNKLVATLYNILPGKEMRCCFNRVVWEDLSNAVTFEHRLYGTPKDVLPRSLFKEGFASQQGRDFVCLVHSSILSLSSMLST